MSQKLYVVIPGQPQGARRHRSTKRGHTYSDPKHVPALEAVTDAFRAKCGAMGAPFEPTGAFQVEIIAYLKRPQTMCKARKWWGDAPRRCLKKPDIDNIAKLVLDGITAMGLWHDDAQVVALGVESWFDGVRCDGTQPNPRVFVCVSQVKTRELP